MNISINNDIFRKNDIRGIVGEDITPELFKLIAKAYSKYIIKNNKDEIWITIARDARSHSPELASALIEGLISSGINVLDLGLCPTPLAYFSEFSEKEGFPDVQGTLIITASHNPPKYNGLKMTYDKNAFNADQIIKVRELVKEGQFIESSRQGICKKYNIVPDYIEFVSKSFSNAGKGVKIVVDSGNGTGGIVAPELYRKLGCEVIDIFSEPDSNFPNHHPNPSNEKNLVQIIDKVFETNADFGIAFDGDSDRFGVVDNTGYSIPGDQLLLIFALDILENLKNTDKKPVFISEVKCSQILFDEINKHGGEAIMWKTGHAFIKSKMKEENATLAGEMSGHIFFRDKFFGFDDAIYAGCRFIEILSKKKLNNPEIKASDLVNTLPKSYTTREIAFPCPEEFKSKIIENLKSELKENPGLFGEKISEIITIDGLRVVFNDGFALVRASNTEPIFTLRFEGKTQEILEKYKNSMLKILEERMEKLKAVR